MVLKLTKENSAPHKILINTLYSLFAFNHKQRVEQPLRGEAFICFCCKKIFADCRCKDFHAIRLKKIESFPSVKKKLFNFKQIQDSK